MAVQAEEVLAGRQQGGDGRPDWLLVDFGEGRRRRIDTRTHQSFPLDPQDPQPQVAVPNEGQADTIGVTISDEELSDVTSEVAQGAPPVAQGPPPGRVETIRQLAQAAQALRDEERRLQREVHRNMQRQRASVQALQSLAELTASSGLHPLPELPANDPDEEIEQLRLVILQLNFN